MIHEVMIKGILRSSFQFLWQTTLRNIFCFASTKPRKRNYLSRILWMWWIRFSAIFQMQSRFNCLMKVGASLSFVLEINITEPDQTQSYSKFIAAVILNCNIGRTLHIHKLLPKHWNREENHPHCFKKKIKKK